MIEVAKKDFRTALNNFFAQLLSSKALDALLVPRDVAGGESVMQTLVRSSEDLDGANPLAPVVPVNAGSIVSQITRLPGGEEMLGVVLRPCEIRAALELAKLKQVDLERVIFIGLDCPGRLSVKDYAERTGKGENLLEILYLDGKNARDGLLGACQACDYPRSPYFDINIGFLGGDITKDFTVIGGTKKGREFLRNAEIEEDNPSKAGKAALEKEIQKRKDFAAQLHREFKETAGGIDNLEKVFARCIGCHNCMNVCPICYCQECFFESSTFDSPANRYMKRAERKKGLRMPSDILLFHLTRLNHMATSCVACGSCEEACPNDVSLLKIFRNVSADVQAVFDYIAGRSPDDELPLTAFREDELTDIGH